MTLRFKDLKIIVLSILFLFCFFTKNVYAEITPQIKSGGIPQANYLTFKKELSGLGINYIVKYLPQESFTYGKDIYAVAPTSIWWHWDAGSTPTKNTNVTRRVLNTYSALASRTSEGEHVSTHFSVGPNIILQMLPLGKDVITQGRLTNDLKIDDVTKSPSLGGIQIETTGRYYDDYPPLASQTDALIKLTAILMKQYHIPFSKIFGHLEVSPNVGKIDPGIKYLKQTRIKLLKYLIAHSQLENIGSPDSWNFYTQVLEDGVITNVPDQSSSDIFKALTKSEQKNISNLKI